MSTSSKPIDIPDRLIQHKRNQARLDDAAGKGPEARVRAAPHRCPNCQCDFPSKESFWSHFNKHHSESVPQDRASAFQRKIIEETRLNYNGSPVISHDTLPAKKEAEAVSQDEKERSGRQSPNSRRTSPKRKTAELVGDFPKVSRTHMTPGSPRAQRNTHGGCKTKSGRQPIKDPEFDRNLTLLNSTTTKPEATTRELYNPHSDHQTHGVTSDGSRSLDTARWKEPRSAIYKPVQASGLPAQAQIVKRGQQDVAFDQPLGNQPQVYPDESPERLRMIREPVTRPISPEQLIAEVKGIYAGLIMVEAKCVDVDGRQHQAALDTDGRQKPLEDRQWQALIALHKTLLHEHHDFFLASQHPSASAALKKLAQKYAMPARMWKHAIHSFLELLRHRLPQSLEHMLTFIYISYSMMSLLFETVPTFQDTWIECLGDLARYRMAIEDDDIRDRETWQNTARQWYAMAADRTPEVGRLYHHLAILARPNILSQLFFYCKSLNVSQIFSAARESILTVFDPMFHPEALLQRNQPADAAFIQLHSITFTKVDLQRFPETLEHCGNLLLERISEIYPDGKYQATENLIAFRVQSTFMAVCNITAIFGYGQRDSMMRKIYKGGVQSRSVPEPSGDDGEEKTSKSTSRSEEGKTRTGNPAMQEIATLDEHSNGHPIIECIAMASTILSIMLNTPDEGNPHGYIYLIFLNYLARSVPAMRFLEDKFPWDNLIDMLNFIIGSDVIPIDGDIMNLKVCGRPLPEDYHLRGLIWTKHYFPPGYFEEAAVDMEERGFERPEMTTVRKTRILALGIMLASAGDWILFDQSSRRFSVTDTLRQRIQESQIKQEEDGKTKMDVSDIYPIAEDEDAPAGIGGSGSEDEYVHVMSDSMRQLKEKQKELQEQIRAARTSPPAVVTAKSTTRTAPAKGTEALKLGYTALIIDTNFLISHLNTFENIVDAGWTVIVPNVVITELHGLKNNADIGTKAESAEIAITKAIKAKRDVRILTSKGSDVTKRGFMREKLDRDDDHQNLDDIISRTTKLVAVNRRASLGSMSPAEPAVLLTEDANLRLKSNVRGITAIGTTVLKRFLDQKSSQKVHQRRAPLLPQPTEPRVYIKSENDDVDIEMSDAPMLESLDVKNAHDDRFKNEQDILRYTAT